MDEIYPVHENNVKLVTAFKAKLSVSFLLHINIIIIICISASTTNNLLYTAL
jgi:hypothetical protein